LLDEEANVLPRNQGAELAARDRSDVAEVREQWFGCFVVNDSAYVADPLVNDAGAWRAHVVCLMSSSGFNSMRLTKGTLHGHMKIR
jgi:hypothetical protein